ncbi:MAG TPA: hypothetical protein VN841_27330 [Bryobacteraceae bacterium]|nr:hypothetical protein [Bryobacteraceae bacterium]
MSVKQPSEKQNAASRINGAKSKGPVSVDGRARSSRNALRHGLSSAVVVLPHEDRAQFEQLRESYMESFQPADQPQHDLVETMAAARWRLNRLQEIEANLFEKEMVLRASEMAKELKEMTEGEKLAWVFDRMANHSKSLAMQIRYEGQLNRTYERAFKQLQQLQKPVAQASAGESAEIQNEPEPTAPTAPPDPQPLPNPVPPSPQSPKENPNGTIPVQNPTPAEPDPGNRL